MIAQVGGVLHRWNHTAAAHAGQFVFQSLDYRGLGAPDAREKFGKLKCGNLQHEAPCREIARRC